MNYKYKDREAEYLAEYQRANWVRIKAYRAARTKEQRAYLATLQVNGCMDCGNPDVRVLDFHHRIPKNGAPALTTMVGTGCHSMDRIKQEAAKCDVVCANCHRLRHA